MVGEGSVSFSNQEVQSNSFEGGSREWRRLKFEAGKSYRIRFTSQQVEFRKRHYNPRDKRYYRCLANTGYCPVCLAASKGYGGEGQFKLRKAGDTFGANVLVYSLDQAGNPVRPLDAEVYFWSFGPDKFVQIRELQAAWGGDITKLDLKVTCTDAQFQRVSVINLPECLYFSDPAFKAACDEKIKRDSYPLAKMICREADLAGVIQAFGLPSEFWPPEMLSQMPQGNQTPVGYAAGSQPQQSAVQPGVYRDPVPQGGWGNPAGQAPGQSPVYQQNQGLQNGQNLVYQQNSGGYSQNFPVQQNPGGYSQNPGQNPVYQQGSGYQQGSQSPVQAPDLGAAPVNQELPFGGSSVSPIPGAGDQAVPVPDSGDAYADLNELQALLG